MNSWIGSDDGQVAGVRKRCQIVVPIYRALSAVEAIVLEHNARQLGRYPFVLVGPPGATQEIEQARMIVGVANAEAEIRLFTDADFSGIAAYNALLRGRRFLDAFADTDFALICQTDAVVLQEDLAQWIEAGFDFVGAPIFAGYRAPTLPPRFVTGLNGGLSLRNLVASRAALDRVAILPDTRGTKVAARAGALSLVNRVLSTLDRRVLLDSRATRAEDMFWTVDIQRLVPTFRVAPPEMAAHFAFEALPEQLLETTGGALPFGCHAWQRYAQNFWLEKFPYHLVSKLHAVLG